MSEEKILTIDEKVRNIVDEYSGKYLSKTLAENLIGQILNTVKMDREWNGIGKEQEKRINTIVDKKTGAVVSSPEDHEQSQKKSQKAVVSDPEGPSETGTQVVESRKS